ncbi:MAG: putative rane protein [Verrucomicrobiaceae bacterium]|nr:putative rane protein [Verrucomicrobiaceae bacterium]
MTKNQLWEQTAVLLALGILIGGCALIIAPFAPALLWAAIMSFTTWGIFLRLSRRLGNRKMLASSLLVGSMLVLIVLPLIFALIAFAAQANELYEQLRLQMESGLPALPSWVTGLPYVGTKLGEQWHALGEGDPEVLRQVRNGLMWMSTFLLQMGKSAGQGFGVLLLSCILVFFFYVGGERGRYWLEGTLFHIAGTRGVELLHVAANTVKSVVFGILGTAAAQGILAGIGFAIAGVPMVVALALGTAVLSLVPFGPALLWGPAAFWLYHEGHTGWAIFMALWGMLIVSMADNVIKPMLIGKGANLPFLLIMLGVLGGAMSFGLLGVFLGPTFLAVGFALLRDWVQQRADNKSFEQSQ